MNSHSLEEAVWREMFGCRVVSDIRYEDTEVESTTKLFRSLLSIFLYSDYL